MTSDERCYGNLTFDDVLARQGSSFCCIEARLNFQAFSLRDMKWWQERLSRSSKDELLV